MRVAFRTDASLEIGTGHVMRCLTLADALSMRGGECVFICRPHHGHLLEQIRARGHEVRALLPPPASFVAPADDTPHAAWLGLDWARDAEEARAALNAQDVDWLVVDHYALDHRWEELVRSACGHLMVMDDLADRPHNCDLLLDPSLGRTSADYTGLLPAQAVMLLGPRFALLRPEFAQLREESLARRASPELRHLLITMGGVDKDNATAGVLDALDGCILPPDVRITTVMGPHSPWLADVQARAARMRIPTRVRVEVKDMARLMTDSDLAIGAAGSTSWERCCLGLPTIQLVLAENQMECATRFSQLGAALGISSIARIREELPSLVGKLSSTGLRHMSDCAALICEGHGASLLAQRLLHSVET